MPNVIKSCGDRQSYFSRTAVDMGSACWPKSAAASRADVHMHKTKNRTLALLFMLHFCLVFYARSISSTCNSAGDFLWNLEVSVWIFLPACRQTFSCSLRTSNCQVLGPATSRGPTSCHQITDSSATVHFRRIIHNLHLFTGKMERYLQARRAQHRVFEGT